MAGLERIRGFLRAGVPGLSVVAGYRREWLRSDLVAGVTVAAYVLPAGLADASIARLPPEAGLYACLASALVFWLFCSSRHTVVTTTGAISLLVGASLQPLDGGDPARHATLAAATALIVGGLGALAWLLRAGVLVSFISETVLIGFKCGVAFQIASTQLPKLFGFPGGHGNFWEQVSHFVRDIDQTNAVALLVGGAALVLLAFSKQFLPRIPMGIIVVVAGIAISAAAGLSHYGVKLLGTVPQGLPPISLPPVSLRDVEDLLPIAMACFLLGAVESAAIGRMFAKQYGYRFEANPEFLALAASNLAAGVVAGFPVSGGMSQSLVNESSGARTVVSGLVSAVILLLVTLFLSGALRDLPQPVLAAIILVAIAGLVKVNALKRIWRFSRAEFVISMAAFLGVLHLGLLKGVLIGAVMSLIVLLRRGSRPYTAELGRIPGSDVFADVARHPEYAFEPDVFVFRVSSPLLYFNAEFVSDSFFAMLARRAGPVRLAVFFLGNVPDVDIAGAEMLIETARAVRARGMDFHLAEVHGPVRKHLRAAGYEDACGPIDKHKTVDTLVRAWRGTNP